MSVVLALVAGALGADLPAARRGPISCRPPGGCSARTTGGHRAGDRGRDPHRARRVGGGKAGRALLGAGRGVGNEPGLSVDRATVAVRPPSRSGCSASSTTCSAATTGPAGFKGSRSGALLQGADHHRLPEAVRAARGGGGRASSRTPGFASGRRLPGRRGAHRAGGPTSATCSTGAPGRHDQVRASSPTCRWPSCSARVRPGVAIAPVMGATIALLPDDLNERLMLGDSGANVIGRGARPRCGAGPG